LIAKHHNDFALGEKGNQMRGEKGWPKTRLGPHPKGIKWCFDLAFPDLPEPTLVGAAISNQGASFPDAAMLEN